MQRQYRQGDVFIIQTDMIPAQAEKQNEKSRIVLEHGEVTGHAHAINDTKEADLYLQNARKFLEVCMSASVSHEEHKTIVLPKGNYEVRRQCTWSALEAMARLVAD